MGDIPSRQQVYAYVKQDRFIINDCSSTTPFVGSTDVSAIALSTNHREGAASISFAKSGVSSTAGQISQTFAANKQLNLVDYLRGRLRFWINLSTLADVANVQLIIGESASHNNIYQVADTTLTTGWNEVNFDVDSPTSVTGDGAAWGSIGYIAVKVNFDANGNTLTAILVDAISIIYEININVDAINLSGTGLATAANQALQLAQETLAAASLSVIDDWDETDRCKVNLIAGQVGVAAGAGAVGANTQRMTLASDDPAVASLSVMDDWDETDRCKVNLIASQAGVDGNAGAATAATQRMAIGSTSMLVRGEDTTGQDAYATIITPATACTHIMVSVGGSNDAIISLNAGTTEHFVAPAGSVLVLDAVTITASTAIQAKNRTAGSNYANLFISVW